MLSDIEVLDRPDDDYWMAKAYRVPDTPLGHVEPGAQGFPTKPISTMPPRSWITSLADGATVYAELRGKRLPARIAPMPFVTQTYKR